jgi:hypothetical protein
MSGPASMPPRREHVYRATEPYAPTQRRCNECKITKPIGFFSHKDGRAGLIYDQVCIPCRKRAAQPKPPDPFSPATRKAMCDGKVGYLSQPIAAAAAAKLVLRKRRTGRLRVYECPICHLWHLTKRPT